jgi:LDH2 family malate/lactate/ureidoglycolate dehydrogenase
MKIPTHELKEKVSTLLIASGMSAKDADTLSNIVIEQEIIGNQFSAIGGVATHYAKPNDAIEEVVVTKPALQLIKGNGRIAPLITADHLDEVIEKAKTQGIFAVGIYDSTYNDFFDVFCRRVAAQNCIALMFENGGPQGVVPFGGRKDVMGTNPLAYGIPTNTYPIIFDAATAAHAYGRIRQAKESGEKLPDNAYVDKDGNVTTDPHEAHAVLPFGGFKGYALNLLVDVLSGALVRGKSGLDMPSGSERHIGTLLIVIDPAAFGELSDFKNATTKLVADLLAVPAVDPSKPVRVPGIRGSERLEKSKQEGVVEIEDKEWEKFEEAFQKIKTA